MEGGKGGTVEGIGGIVEGERRGTVKGQKGGNVEGENGYIVKGDKVKCGFMCVPVLMGLKLTIHRIQMEAVSTPYTPEAQPQSRAAGPIYF